MKKLAVTISFYLLILSHTFILSQKKSEAVAIINADLGRYTINKNIYGHFSEHLGHCIYGGIWVGENSEIPNTRGVRNDIIEALKKISIPLLRWPGGCFADEYHWMDGIGPRDKRPKMINTHWGGVVENNSFGTHEFLDLCEMIGAEPYICGNLGSGTIEEMSKWIEYLTFDGESPMANLRRQNGREKPWRIKYWGVGNENWGCGGNMTAEFYADQYKRYATYCRNYGENKLFKIAGGGLPDDFNWIETLVKKIDHSMIQGLSLHYYTVPRDWSDKGSATEFDEAEYFATIQKCLMMEDLIKKYKTIMDKYDATKKVSMLVDEWGNWFNVEPGTNPGFLYQQNTLRDAITAATNLNIFNNNADRIAMANIAQMVNVLQALILTDGPKIVLTPTYYVYEMFKVHQNALLLPIDLKCGSYQINDSSVPDINISSSKSNDGKIYLTIVNVNPNTSVPLNCEIRGQKISGASGRILTADTINSMNTFEKADSVNPAKFTDIKLKGNNIAINIPSKSIIVLEVLK